MAIKRTKAEKLLRSMERGEKRFEVAEEAAIESKGSDAKSTTAPTRNSEALHADRPRAA